MNITPRDKKFLAAGAAAVCVFILLKFLVLPFYDKAVEQKQDIEMKERMLEKYTRFVEQQSEVQQQLKDLGREERKAKSSLLTGETPSLAAADIQKIIESIAEKSKVEVKSVKVMDAYEEEGFQAIPLQISFGSDLSKMNTFIRSIETNRKLLTIPELKIRVKNKRKPGEISVTLKVVGFMQKRTV